MNTKKATAILLLDDKREVSNFSQWLSRNKNSIEAISRNDGCGCCVDIFYLIVQSNIEANKLVEEQGSTFDESKLLYLEQKDKYIDFLTKSYNEENQKDYNK